MVEGKEAKARRNDENREWDKRKAKMRKKK